MNVQAQDI